jgi:hypothetical protein
MTIVLLLETVLVGSFLSFLAFWLWVFTVLTSF